jgi:hypothetical protein
MPIDASQNIASNQKTQAARIGIEMRAALESERFGPEGLRLQTFDWRDIIPNQI